MVEADKYIWIFYFTADMDNIQFWIYVIFAIIYFVAKNFKKGSKNQDSPDPREQRPQPTQAQSFEDLLEEITGRKSLKEQPKQEIEEPDPFAEAFEERYLQPKPWEAEVQERQAKEQREMEGRNRQFADDESRRVYEESIKRAEGAGIEYSLDEHYASRKVLRSTAEEKDGHSIASEIKEMLDNTADARKAVILGEILNRKY